MNQAISLNSREAELCEAIGKAIPHMTEFQKGYFLGVAESTREQHKAREEEEDSQEK